MTSLQSSHLAPQAPLVNLVTVMETVTLMMDTMIITIDIIITIIILEKNVINKIKSSPDTLAKETQAENFIHYW
jgi:hypothetical protein